MNFELLTLSGVAFRGQIEEVNLTTASGAMGLLPHHEPLTAIIVPGPVVIRPQHGQAQFFASFGGLLEVNADNTARLLADEAEHAEELIQDEIRAALEQAEKLKASAKDKHELSRAQQLIDRHTVRLDVARLHRHHRDRRRP